MSGVRNRFKTAEGRFHLHSERASGTQAFSYLRAPRLTLASLQGGAEDGLWVLYSVGDHIHFARYDSTHKEPYKSIHFNSSPVRTGYPTCHSFAAAKDGIDLLVGLGDGSVLLMSARAQLQASGLPAKPVAVATLQPEGVSETNRCVAVAWVPRSESGQFIAAYNTGNIYVYKKTHLLGETSGKFSLSLGSSSKSQTPSTVIPINGGGISDAAVSPDGRTVAVACRDGALRLVDLASGTVVCGCSSYYGAVLCCAFSPDGKYVAAGSEDDLVVVFGMAERFPLLHGEGHRSWVSRVAWDPWAGSEPSSGSRSTLSDLGPSGRIYRLGSVGQDCQMCLWDMQPFGEGDVAATPGTQGHKRNGSMGALTSMGSGAIRMSSGGVELLHGPASNDRKGGGVGAGPKSTGICPPLQRLEMYIVQPIMEHRLHPEPMSDVLFTEEAIYTIDHSGVLRTWRRPRPEAGSGERE